MATIKSERASVLRQIAGLQRAPKETDGPETEVRFHELESDGEGHIVMRSSDTRLLFETRVPCGGNREPWRRRLKNRGRKKPFYFLEGAGWEIKTVGDVLGFQRDRMWIPYHCQEIGTDFPEPEVAGTGHVQEVDAKQLYEALLFVSHGSQPSESTIEDDDTRRGVCSLFMDGIAMGATKWVNWQSPSPALPFDLLLSKGNSKRVAAWLGVITSLTSNRNSEAADGKKEDEATVQTVEVAETTLNARTYYRFRTSCGSFKLWVIRHPAAFKRRFVEQSAGNPCSMLLKISRDRLLANVRLVGGMGPRLVCRCSLSDDSAALHIETDHKDQIGRSRGEIDIDSFTTVDPDSDTNAFRIGARQFELALRPFKSDYVMLAYRPKAGSVSVFAHDEKDGHATEGVAILKVGRVETSVPTESSTMVAV